jgi:hypothetical protein
LNFEALRDDETFMKNSAIELSMFFNNREISEDIKDW